MDLKNIKKGEKIIFELGEKSIESTYFGRFDFLYCFDTKFKMLPKVTTIDKSSIVIMNLELLNKYDFSVDEVNAILYHEVGHIISVNQGKLEGMDLELDADEYAVLKSSQKNVISSLEKTKNVIVNESTNEKVKNDGLEALKKRIENIKIKDKFI